MSRRDDSVRLRHMLDAARKATEYTSGLSLEAVRSDEMRALALVRLLEIIGEAARGISPEFRSSHPTIPWSQVIALRNRLIHGYFDVDFSILWRILEEELPALVGEPEKLAGDEAS